MAVVNVATGVVVVADVWRGVAVEDGLRSQGFGGDACMSKGMGRSKVRLMPLEPARSHMISYIHASSTSSKYSTSIRSEDITAKMSINVILVEYFFGVNPPEAASSGRITCANRQ